MRGAAPLVALLLAAAGSSACAEGPGRTTATAVDSAGVRIVTNPPGSIEAAEAWSLSPQPVVEIGAGANPDLPLHQVTAVVPLGEGRVAVATNSPPRVLVVDSEGTVAAILGGPGEGPGEFSSVASVVPLGADSIVVWDDIRRRMSVFTPDGRYVRDVDLSDLALPTPLGAASTSQPAAWTHLLPSGSGSVVLFQVGVWGGTEVGVRRVEAPSFRVTTTGRELARFGPFPGEQTYDFGPGQGGPFIFPFGADTHAAAAGDALVVGTAEAPELRRYAPDGSLEQIVRWPDEDRTLGGAFLSDWSGFVDSWLAPMPPREREMFRGILDAIPQPERFPAYDDLVAADEGDIWVGSYAGEHSVPYPPRNAPVPARRWLVFDPHGELIARVHTPEGFMPHAIRDGRAWGIFTDDLEVESVRAFEVARP